MFVLLKGPDGGRLLLNLDTVVVIQEGAKGEAIAIATSGHGVNTGELFETVMSDLLEEGDGEA